MYGKDIAARLRVGWINQIITSLSMTLTILGPILFLGSACFFMGCLFAGVFTETPTDWWRVAKATSLAAATGLASLQLAPKVSRHVTNVHRLHSRLGKISTLTVLRMGPELQIVQLQVLCVFPRTVLLGTDNAPETTLLLDEIVEVKV